MKPMKLIKCFVIFFLVVYFYNVSVSQSTVQSDFVPPKNIVLMIADGMGYNHLMATYYFLYGTNDSCIFSNNNFLSLAQATYSARLNPSSKEDNIWSSGYNPQLIYKNPSKLIQGATCSAAAATAIATGKKTFNGSIGLGIYNDTLVNIVNAAKAKEKSAGLVTSVQLSHATPAAFVANSHSRNNYIDISIQMILSSQLDVLMGCGNPDFDNNGMPAGMNARYVGGNDIWQQLKTNSATSSFSYKGENVELLDAYGVPNPWSLIQDSIEFQALLGSNPPKRVLGLPKVYRTLQQERTVIHNHKNPFETPFIPEIPDLRLMTKGALNVLNQNHNGFFLMIEGGAIDWASHDNQSDRMIEEMIGFLNTVNAVIQWIEVSSSWEETLLIITSDHECGFLWGAGGTNFRRPIINNGKGTLPTMKWYSADHTNSLVPFFAKGAGSHLFDLFADEYDPVHGYYIQNTEIAHAIFLLWGKPEN